jgi:hypothetical protein
MELPALKFRFSSVEGIARKNSYHPGDVSSRSDGDVDTWKDSWFEQGTRVFYIVPSRTIDSILHSPLIEARRGCSGICRANGSDFTCNSEGSV